MIEINPREVARYLGYHGAEPDPAVSALIDRCMEEVNEAAEYFSAVLFGKEQTEKLMDFYAGDGACVINICGQIFKDQLTDKITAAQKRMKV